jgi:hypothetical protein
MSASFKFKEFQGEEAKTRRHSKWPAEVYKELILEHFALRNAGVMKRAGEDHEPLHAITSVDATTQGINTSEAPPGLEIGPTQLESKM